MERLAPTPSPVGPDQEPAVRRGGIAQWLRSCLFQPVDAAGLVVFRIAFGVIMLWEVGRFFYYDRISAYYVDPAFHFTYFGFGWVTPLPSNALHIVFVLLGVLAVCIAVGLAYRIATALFFLGFAYVFLLDQAQYLNHFYLITLLSGLMIFVPAHRSFSLDARLRLTTRSKFVSQWAYWLLRAQIGIVYFYAGLAKLNVDWLRGEPMRMWLAERTDFPLIGSLFTSEWVVFLASYGALCFDLGVTFLLLWRRTRKFAFVSAVCFHLMNTQLFNIGIFPWMMIAATTLFFDPGWIRFRRSRLLLPEPTPMRYASFIMIAIGIYLSIQILLPLRHFLYPGEVNWTEEGHRFSWHMLLRSKRGDARFFATDAVRAVTWEIDPHDYLTDNQVDEMTTRQDMLLQFAHYVAGRLEAQGNQEVEVRVWAMLSLNSRAPQLMIDPQVDLAAQPREVYHNDWILPLMQPTISDGGVPLLLITRTPQGLVMTNAGESNFPLTGLVFQVGDTVISRQIWGAGSLGSGQCIVLQGGQTPPPNLICEQIVRLPLNLPELVTSSTLMVQQGDRAPIDCPRRCLIQASAAET